MFLGDFHGNLVERCATLPVRVKSHRALNL